MPLVFIYYFRILHFCKREYFMKDLTNGNEAKLIAKFAAPMLLGNLFQQIYHFVDRIIVGNLIGKEALAATGASFPLIFALISFVIGISAGGTIVISQYFGAKDYDRVRRAIDTIYIFVFVCSIAITIIGVSFSRWVFQLTKLPDDIVPQAVIYFNTFISGTILLFGFNGTSAILRGLGDSKTPLVFLVFSTITNIVLDIVFIKYFNWGIRGAALATVVAQGGAFVSAIIYLNRNHHLVKLYITKLVFDKEIFVKSFRIGLPSGFQQTFVALGMIALFSIVNQFGTDVVAAYSVAGGIDSLAMQPAMNFGQALSTFVGQNIGAGKTSRVRSGLVATITLSSVTSIIVAVVILFFRSELMMLFTKDANVIGIGNHYLLIVSSCYVIFSIMFSINGVLRGAGDTLVPMFFTLIALWGVRVPLAYILSKHMGVTGIWLSVPLGWLVGTTCSFFYYLTGKWKTKSVV